MGRPSSGRRWGRSICVNGGPGGHRLHRRRVASPVCRLRHRPGELVTRAVSCSELLCAVLQRRHCGAARNNVHPPAWRQSSSSAFFQGLMAQEQQPLVPAPVVPKADYVPGQPLGTDVIARAQAGAAAAMEKINRVRLSLVYADTTGQAWRLKLLSCCACRIHPAQHAQLMSKHLGC